MSDRKRYIAVLLAIVLAATGLTGCIGDGDDDDWKNPTGISFDSLDAEHATQTVYVNFSLVDKDDVDTKADGNIRVAIWDSKGFEMLNKTFEIKSKDFSFVNFLGLKISMYSLEIPFSDLQKSHDRGYLSVNKAMHGTAWFTFKDTSFEDDYDSGILNPTIPEDLLHPNEAPQGDMVVNNPGFVGMSVECNGSASSDLEEGSLDFDWSWGDGDTTPSSVATAVESHVYDLPGTYTITMTVTDPEDATDTETMDITIDWALAITINGWGVVTEGDYVNQTYVEITIVNQASTDISLPLDGFAGISILDAADGEVVAGATDPTLPTSMAAAEEVTIMVYFDAPGDFTAVDIDIWGREFTLP